MKRVIDLLIDLPEYKLLCEYINKGKFPLNITGVSGAQKAHIIAGIFSHSNKSCLIVTHDELHAQTLYEDINHFLPEKVVFFPVREVVFYNVDAISKDVMSKRLDVLERLLRSEEKLIVITTFRALMQKLPSVEMFKQFIVSLHVGDEVKIDDLIEKFITGGYERVDIVEGRCQFAVRGGIIDFCQFSNETGYRIEMFGDTIESIRKFEPTTQRSIESVDEVVIFPVTEAIYERRELDKIIENILIDLEITIKENRLEKEQQEKLKENIYEDIEKLKEIGSLNNIERYFTHFYENGSLITDFFNGDFIVCLDEPQRLFKEADNFYLEFIEMYKSLLERGMILTSCCKAVLEPSQISSVLERLNLVSLTSIYIKDEFQYKERFILNGKDIGGFYNFEQVLTEVKKLKKSGYRVILLAGNQLTAQRVNQEFRDREIESIYCDTLDYIEIKPKQVIVTSGNLSSSFEYPLLKLVIISDKRIFGVEKKRKYSKRTKIELTDLSLAIGDYVVHQVHGIGQYIGLDSLEVDGIRREYVKIKYANDDLLYIPTTQLELIQKYVGVGGKAPKLNKLGGVEWAKTKKKVKNSLKNIADELIKLYAQRQTVKGFAFSKDTVWQKQFEEEFPYQETPDQLRCIEEVKRDMESEKVMDRLLCGDVGFGKTEVALRAAFKAVMDGKQVAYLVPTTVLAQQHFNTFTQRMMNFPIKVAMLSRFVTISQQKKILKGLKNGEIDILIGTHRILQKDIQFKDLGLLIIDEEQKFGVTHKERLKKLKSNVDVLTLTATPIPRTLHMALVGIRDISVIYDPPEDRYPVQTFVMEYDKEVIKDAITRELNRKGQVYYLSNKVKSIYKVATYVQSLVPQAKIVVAHGQMNEKELERVMVDFVEGKGDILVCTTIIESGLDIPNVNTIIIEDADKVGLSQLYQLRGRVGRSNRLAYAYITYRKDKILSQEAEKRLKAIKDFTEFGSGFKIAMRDLEIRGAGNLLGPEQHGHLEAVGYDMYCRLLEEAVKELRGEEVKEDINVHIDININAFISKEYITNEEHRLEMYKKIALAQEEAELEEIENELIDRYGEIPKEVYNLLAVTQIKILAKKAGIVSVVDKGKTVIFQFKGSDFNIDALGKLIDMYKEDVFFTASEPPYLTYKIDIRELNSIQNIKNLLQSLNDLQCSS